MITAGNFLSAFKVWFDETVLAMQMTIVVEDLNSIEVEITGNRLPRPRLNGLVLLLRPSCRGR